MPSRKRYTPASGFENRIADPVERLLVRVAGLPMWFAGHQARLLSHRGPMPFEASTLRDVLVLRLDRIGDLTMTLPALADLRAALPSARIRLAVGRWSAEIARRAPVDQVLEWNAPWVGRRDEGADSWTWIMAKARGTGGTLDLAVDLSCDPRANFLLYLTGAQRRVGYANAGFGSALTHLLPLDETVSWVVQSQRAVASITGRLAGSGWPPIVTADERAEGERRLARAGLRPGRPVIGLHPGGGREVKQWPIERWVEVARRLHASHGARFALTGSVADGHLAAAIARALGPAAVNLAGSLSLAETLGVLSALDLFLSPDTGPMHLACALGTPTVSVFGPSDPRRFFSGGTGESGSRHVAVHAPLWCSPCNQIRRPPKECLGPAGPECLQLVTTDAVYREAARLLVSAGFSARTA